MTGIITAGRRYVELPLDDEVVLEHFKKESSFAQCLLEQINLFRQYEFIFAGRSRLRLLDIGANIGLVSVYAHDVCEQIVCVEPSPNAFAVLERVASRFPPIATLRAALTGEDGPCTFHVNDINSTANSVVNTYGDEIEVVGMTLKSIIQGSSLDRIDVCKVDVEGSEEDALTLEQVMWAKPIIQSYYVETHNCPKTTWQYKLGKLVEIFSSSGYMNMTVHGMEIYAKK